MTQNSNKEDKSLKNTPPPPLPFAHQIKDGKKEKKALEKGSDMTYDDAMKMIREMEQMHDKIDKMMSEVIERTGWSPRYLREYLDNPNNFSSTEQWTEVQKRRKELKLSIKTTKQLQREEEMAKNAPVSVRRSRVAGQRRNWLPMR